MHTRRLMLEGTGLLDATILVTRRPSATAQLEILGFAENNITGYIDIASILNPYELYQTSKCTYAQPQAYVDVAALGM